MRTVHPVRKADRYKQDHEFYRFSRHRYGEQSEPVCEAPSAGLFAKCANLPYAEEAARSIASIVTSAKLVRDALEEVRSGNPFSALWKRTVVSSDEAAATASARYGTQPQSATVRVLRLAQKQVNSGPAFLKTSPATVPPGFHRFFVRVGERMKELEVYIYASDTNESALQRIRNALNSCGLGITAWLLAGEQPNMIRLEVQSRETGAAHAFSIADMSGSAVSATGIHLTDQQAADAQYQVNDGPVLRSSVNTVELKREGLTVVFRKTAPDGVRFTVLFDAERLVERIQRLTDRINGMKTAAEQADGCIDPAIARSLHRALAAANMEPLGLSLQADGFLALDAAALRERIEHSFTDVARSLEDGPATLPGQLGKLLARLESAPAEALLDRSRSDFMRYANYSPTMERYSQLPFHGVLLNYRF